MELTVTIGCHPAGSWHQHALVGVDVIRATTTAVTAIALGRQCYPVTNVEAARRVATAVPEALLVGELGGTVPEGFHLNNSPAALAARADRRPVVLLSSSGTQLIDAMRLYDPAYVACFRNMTATIREVAKHRLPVVVLGSATRGEFREEDQMCGAWIAAGLIRQGYTLADGETADRVAQWEGASRRAFLGSHSVAYLRQSNQLEDLDFILTHFDDIDFACRIVGPQILREPALAVLPTT